MSHENTNWGQSVAGVVIRDGKVLLARHTYGRGNGLLIIPGGYVDYGETPQDALKREFLEETGVLVEPRTLIGVRFNMHDWYVVFRAEYVSGDARPDGEENSEVLWIDTEEAMGRADVPDLTKSLLAAALTADGGALTPHSYEGNPKHTPSSLWCS